MKAGRARQLRLEASPRPPAGAARFTAPEPGLGEPLRRFIVPSPYGETPLTEARYLLTAAAEIEHGLLVQYLYAAYSLQGSESARPNAGPTAGAPDRILAVAVEEMGHLLNVQNLLLALGEPPYVDRENYTPAEPTGPPYPFPFVLERVDRTVVAKYVAAESPLPSTIEDDEKREKLLAVIAIGTGGAGTTINHVGVLYAQLYWLFQPTDDAALAGWPDFPPELIKADWHIADSHLTGLADAQTRAAFGPDFGFANLSEDPTERRFVQAIAARQDAVALIRRIAEQGEGLTGPQSAADDSHFEWFLDLYERWEQAGLVVRAVPRFPNTAATASADPVLEEGRITYPPSRAWALLSDVRYELLLLKCGLLFHQSRSDQQGARRRRLLLSSVMFEMRSSLRPLALRLMTLPRRAREPDGSIALFAGPPFSIRDEALPRDEAGLVAALRAGIALAAARAAEIRNISGPDAPTDADRVILDKIAADDTRVLEAFGHA